MKRLFWLSLMGALSFSTGLCDQQKMGPRQKMDPQQNGVFGMYSFPKWYMEASVAVSCYEAGMANLTSNPAEAVRVFQIGLLYARMAEAAGGGVAARNVSMAISRELPIAKKNLADSISTVNAGNNDSNGSDNGNGANNQVQFQSQSHPAAPKANMTVQSGAGLSHVSSSQTGMRRQGT